MSPIAAHAHDLSNLGPLGWTIVGLSALLVGWVLWRAVVLTIRPGEEEPGHIKRLILEDHPQAGGDTPGSGPSPAPRT